MGEATVNSNQGQVRVFWGSDSEFSDISQKFEKVEGGGTEEWFGWSVKLQLLDRDGTAATLSPEPVLFVGAPKANSGVGYCEGLCL